MDREQDGKCQASGVNNAEVSPDALATQTASSGSELCHTEEDWQYRLTEMPQGLVFCTPKSENCRSSHARVAILTLDENDTIRESFGWAVSTSFFLTSTSM